MSQVTNQSPHRVGKSVSQLQIEVNSELNSIISEILEDPLQNVSSAQIKVFISMMRKHFKYFKSAFCLLIDKIVTLEEKDTQIKGIYKLIDKFYNELPKSKNISNVDVNSLMEAVIEQLINIYNISKLGLQVQSRAAYMLSQISSHFQLLNSESLKLSNDLKLQIQDAAIDMLHSGKHTIEAYGVQLSCNICNQNKANDQVFLTLMKLLTHSKSREVRKSAIANLKAPLSPVTLLFLSKRLRDKDDEIRRITFKKLVNNGIRIDSFQSKEQRMLIIKEGLTDQNDQVRAQCIEFLKPTLFKDGIDGEVDLSIFFKLIDCKKMFIKEYYIQLPFIIMRFIFHCLEGENELKIAQYLQKILNKMKYKAGICDNEDVEMSQTGKKIIQFEEILFLRIALEFSKLYKNDRPAEFIDIMDQMQLSYEDYYAIFNYLLNNTFSDPDENSIQHSPLSYHRLVFSEWVKFSLQLAIEEEVTRRNLVSLMFNYISQIKYTYQDYQHLLRQKRFLIKEPQIDEEADQNKPRTSEVMYELSEEEEDFDDEEQMIDDEGQMIIQIEIKAFQDLSMNLRDINEYCKPFAFESLVIDSDDVCRIAVIVARKLLDARIDEFSLSMLQAISDIKEPLEDCEDDQVINYRKGKEQIHKKLDEKLDRVNELITQDDYDTRELNQVMKKIRDYVKVIEEYNLKEKLSYKRALNLCLILLKQCRADVNDQNLISLCETLIGPAIQSKDKDNMLLAIECIGLLCLLDKELFQNYSKIFQRILIEDVMESNLREKIIALRSSVDSLIIHGVDTKTLKLQKIILEDYMVIKDKILRQITIEGICKMLFSRKLTQSDEHLEMEFLLSHLIIQWFDKKFNWQNSLVRQILNTFFKSFVLFSPQRCELLLKSLVKVVFSILEAKHPQINKVNPKQNKKALLKKQQKKRRSYEDSDSDNYTENEEEANFSDDSRIGAPTSSTLENIVKELDPVQITKVFMLLLSKEYINSNASKEFRLQKDLNIEFLLYMTYLNTHHFKKVAVVKEYLCEIVDYIDVNAATNWRQLEILGKYLDLNMKMLIQGSPKIRKVKECIDRRVAHLKTEEQEYEELIEGSGIELEQKISNELDAFHSVLKEYFSHDIQDQIIDLVVDNDDEFNELRTIQVDGLDKSMYSPFGLKKKKPRYSNSAISESVNQTEERLLRRRSGLRSNKKKPNQQFAKTQQQTNKLRSIPEVEEIKDISSSEKPRYGGKMCDTILEEQSILNERQDDDISMQDNPDDEQISNSSFTESKESNSLEMMNNQNQYQVMGDRERRKGIMSKISKQMARDFEKSKMNSLMLSHQGSSCTQVNEQRVIQEYQDGRTVVKISKTKNVISPLNQLQPRIQNQIQNNGQKFTNFDPFQRQSFDSNIDSENDQQKNYGNQNNISHNLSVRFDNIQDSDPKQKPAKKSQNKENLANLSDINPKQSTRSRKNVGNASSVEVSRNEEKKENKSVNRTQQSKKINEESKKIASSLMTRNRMKQSVSSQNSSFLESKDYESDYDSESGSSQNLVNFMESNFSRRRREAQKLQKQAQQKQNNLLVPARQPLKQSQKSQNSQNSSGLYDFDNSKGSINSGNQLAKMGKRTGKDLYASGYESGSKENVSMNSNQSQIKKSTRNRQKPKI